jgi:hypothetical protein
MKKFCPLLLLVIASAAIASGAHAGNEHPERWYQVRWCEAHRGQVEYILPDQTRCDCLTKTHAVEVDFAKKWAEAIGQALHYSAQSGKRAGLVLILESRQDQKYWARLTKIIAYFGLPIDAWAIPDESFKVPF